MIRAASNGVFYGLTKCRLGGSVTPASDDPSTTPRYALRRQAKLAALSAWALP
jgi:hypothetical protein